MRWCSMSCQTTYRNAWRIDIKIQAPKTKPRIAGFCFLSHRGDGKRVLNHRARVFVIGVVRGFGAVLDQVFTANAEPHGNGRSHKHR